MPARCINYCLAVFRVYAFGMARIPAMILCTNSQDFLPVSVYTMHAISLYQSYITADLWKGILQTWRTWHGDWTQASSGLAYGLTAELPAFSDFNEVRDASSTQFFFLAWVNQTQQYFYMAWPDLTWPSFIWLYVADLTLDLVRNCFQYAWPGPTLPKNLDPRHL